MNYPILVVDDQPPVAQLVADVMEFHQQTVYTAGTASEALDVLHHHRISIAIIDIILPDRSGLELCREIRRENPILYLIAITGKFRFFDLAECRSAGFDDYFRKPLDLDGLWQSVSVAGERLTRWLSPTVPAASDQPHSG